MRLFHCNGGGTQTMEFMGTADADDVEAPPQGLTPTTLPHLPRLRKRRRILAAPPPVIALPPCVNQPVLTQADASIDVKACDLIISLQSTFAAQSNVARRFSRDEVRLQHKRHAVRMLCRGCWSLGGCYTSYMSGFDSLKWTPLQHTPMSRVHQTTQTLSTNPPACY